MRKRIKIFILGATGYNGFNTMMMLTKLNTLGQFDIFGYVRDPKSIDAVHLPRIYANDQAEPVHEHRLPRLTPDMEDMAGSDIIINWAGVNLITLDIPKYLETRPDAKQAFDRGLLHERDLLYFADREIVLPFANEALRSAPDCLFIQMSSPTEPMVRFLTKLGFEPGRVVSGGARMEAWRIPQVFQRKETFRDFQLKNFTTLALGEHGRQVVFFPDHTFTDGQLITDVVSSSFGDKGLEKLDEVFSEVRNEGVWLGNKLGQTPHEGPSAVAVDIVRMFVSGMRFSTFLTAYFKEDGYYGLGDDATTVPVLISPNENDDRAVSEIASTSRISMPPEKWDEFRAANKHIKSIG